MGAVKYLNVTGANKNTGPATAGGTKTHFQVFDSDGTTPKSNPFPFATSQAVSPAGMLNLADAGVALKLGVPTIFTAANATNVFSMAGHTLTDTQKVTVVNSGGALPAGLAAGTVYFVRDVVAGVSFKLAATSGGTAIDITTDGTGVQTVIIPGQFTNDMLISLLGEGTTEFEDTDVLKFGESAAMANSADIAAYSVDAWDAAVAF